MAPREPMNLQALDYDAAQDRRIASALLGYARFADLSPSTTLSNAAHGVCEAGHLKVTEKSGTPSMSVDVAAGAAFIAGTNASDQGCYFGENDASYNVAIPTANGTNPRKDLIVARVRDSAYAGADNDLVIECVQGTAAASPSDPTVPDDCIVLARVDVPASDTAITNSQITDLRVASSVWSRPRGRVQVVKVTALDQTITAGVADITGLTMSPVLVAGRYYEARCEVSHYDLSGACAIDLRIEAAGVSVGRGIYKNPNQPNTVKQVLTAYDIIGTGATTIKGRAISSVATGTQKVYADANYVAVLALFDVGGYIV